VSGPTDGRPVVAVHGWHFREDDTPPSGQIAALCHDLREFVARKKDRGKSRPLQDNAERERRGVKPAIVTPQIEIRL
jgi:hypothetical protein